MTVVCGTVPSPGLFLRSLFSHCAVVGLCPLLGLLLAQFSSCRLVFFFCGGERMLTAGLHANYLRAQSCLEQGRARTHIRLISERRFPQTRGQG